MTLQEQLTLVKKAVDNNQLKELFLGSPGYELGNLKHIPANVPSDISGILEQGLYVLYTNGEASIPQRLQTTIFELLDGPPNEIWIAYSICWSQYWNEHKKNAPFQFINEEILSHLQNAVLSNKDDLIACHAFVGWNKKEGLWEDIVVSNQNFKKRFGVGII